MKRLALSFAVAASAFVTGAMAAEPLDVVGFHPGMSLAELNGKLNAYSPKLEIKTTGMQIPELGPDASPWLITATTLPPAAGTVVDQERIVATVTMPPNKVELWAISRQVHYTAGREPVLADLADALRKKYGKEALGFGGKQFYWGWDDKGTPLAMEQMRQCAGWTGINRMMDTQSSVNRALPVPATQKVCPNAKYVSATIVPAGNPALVQDFEVMVMDSDTDIKAMANLRQARHDKADAAAKRQLDDAKQKQAPKL